MSTDTDFQAKAKRYKTAIASIACAHFKAGDVVAVRYSHTHPGPASYFLAPPAKPHHTHWFEITSTQHGPCPAMMYPHTALHSFVL